MGWGRFGVVVLQSLEPGGLWRARECPNPGRRVGLWGKGPCVGVWGCVAPLGGLWERLGGCRVCREPSSALPAGGGTAFHDPRRAGPTHIPKGLGVPSPTFDPGRSPLPQYWASNPAAADSREGRGGGGGSWNVCRG